MSPARNWNGELLVQQAYVQGQTSQRVEGSDEFKIHHYYIAISSSADGRAGGLS